MSWQIHHGEALAIIRTMPSASVDALITDPPYSSGGLTRGDRNQDPRLKYCQTGSATAELVGHFGGDNRDQRSFMLWCTLWLSEALRITRPGGAVAVWTDWRQLPTMTDALQAGGWVWRGIGQWIKTSARPQKGRFSAAAEYLVWGSAGGMQDGNGVCSPGVIWNEPTILETAVSTEDRVHLTQKPDRVMEWALSTVVENGCVLDPFAGSGSTGVACIRTGRSFVGIEYENHYHEVAMRRLRAAEIEHQSRLPLNDATQRQQLLHG